jgi:hypothetical protein
MDFPTTRDEILQRANDEYAKLAALFDQLSDEQMMQQGASGDWSARDVLAHISAEERWLAVQLEALLDGREPTAAEAYVRDIPPPEGADLANQDVRNAWQYERLRGLSLDDVRAESAEWHPRLMRVIERFDDEGLQQELAIGGLGTVGHIRPRREGEPGWPLWRWLAGATYHHYADHAGALRVFVERG